MIALTCFSHCQLHGHSLALWRALCIYTIMYRELHLCPYKFSSPPYLSVTLLSSSCVFLVVHPFLLWTVIFVPLPSILLSHSWRLITGSRCGLSLLRCYLTVENSDFQSICQSCPDKYKGKFSVCNQDASNLGGFEHGDYSQNNNAFVMLSGLFLSCGVKPEEQYQVFKQTESPAVSAFASSEGRHMPIQIQYAGRPILGIFMTIETCHVSETL